MADLRKEPLRLEVVTPEARVLSLSCDEVRAPGAAGGFGVRPGHTPFITSLATGVLTYVAGGETVDYAIDGGFCEVAENRVTVLAEFAEPAAGIDLAEALREHDSAMERMRAVKAQDVVAFRREAALVRRAAARVAASRNHSGR